MEVELLNSGMVKKGMRMNIGKLKIYQFPHNSMPSVSIIHNYTIIKIAKHWHCV